MMKGVKNVKKISYFFKNFFEEYLIPMNRKNKENINDKGKFPITMYAKFGSLEQKYNVIVTAKKAKEFTTAIFQFGDKKPRIILGTKNKIIIFIVESKTKIGIKRMNNNSGVKNLLRS